jgi:hypothetical protein
MVDEFTAIDMATTAPDCILGRREAVDKPATLHGACRGNGPAVEHGSAWAASGHGGILASLH